MSRPAYLLVPWTLTGKNSQPINFNGNQLVGFILPATIASSAMTFSMATTKDTSTVINWIPVNNSSGSISIAVTSATAGYYGFTQDQTAAFAGTEVIRLQGSVSETANQAIYAVLLPRPSI